MNSSILAIVFVLIMAVLLIGCSAVSSSADAAPRVQCISQRMQEFVGQKQIAGAVTLVASPQRVVHLGAVGYSDLEKNTPMRTDNIFWIASMTKPITATAVLMLHERGKLNIDDAAEKYIPEIGRMRSKDGTAVRITLRHMLTHTSGMTDNSPEETRNAKTLADLIPGFTSRPVSFAPGSQWQYCQSGINSLARIVEIVSGTSFDQFLRKELFSPLGMKDTGFYLSPEQKSRLAKSYKFVNGQGEEASVFILDGHDVTYRYRYPAANGGLFSTAVDYGRFARMVLNGGQL